MARSEATAVHPALDSQRSEGPPLARRRVMNILKALGEQVELASSSQRKERAQRIRDVGLPTDESKEGLIADIEADKQHFSGKQKFRACHIVYCERYIERTSGNKTDERRKMCPADRTDGDSVFVERTLQGFGERWYEKAFGISFEKPLKVCLPRCRQAGPDTR